MSCAKSVSLNLVCLLHAYPRWLRTRAVDSAQRFYPFFLSSGALTQAIRNFAKSLEGWLSNAMNAIPQPMIQTKVEEETSKL